MKKRPPARLPKEPLTAKARAAIEQYVRLRINGRGGQSTVTFVCECTLKAERMSRERLYFHLAERGYVWKYGEWVKSRRKLHPQKPKPKAAAPNAVKQVRPPAPKKPSAIPDDPAALMELIPGGKVPISARKAK